MSESDTVNFLRMIAGGERPGTAYIEVRHRQPSGTRWGQVFVDATDVAGAARVVEDLGATLDTYVGMAPRVRRRGTNDDARRAWVLSADCDDDRSVRALGDFAPAPSCVIASGGVTAGGLRKLHAHWALSAPVDAPHFERHKRALCHALGSDPAVVDPARIMRPPGTRHMKGGGAPVEAVHFDPSARFEASSVIDADSAPPAVRVPVVVGDVAHDDELQTISAAEYIAALTGRTPDRAGFVQCPFHKGGEERTPSLKVYGTTWTCFGCPAPRGRRALGGTIYTFAALVCGLPLPLRGAAFLTVRESLYGVFAGEAESAWAA